MVNLRKIGVTARVIPCDQQTLRRIDRAGIFAPRRDRHGHRLYSEQDIEELRGILASRKPGRPRKVPR
ncbi:MAG: MerR family transcriptional regulator [Actinomycetota bacterium]